MKPRADNVVVELAPGRWYVRHRPSTIVVAGPFDGRESAERNAAKRDRIGGRKRSAIRAQGNRAAEGSEGRGD